MMITWIWPAPGDWNMPEPEGTPFGVSRIWSPIRPNNLLDADVSNYTPFPITHSYSISLPEENVPVTNVKSFYSFVAPFIMSGGVIKFATQFGSDSPVESSVILGGQLIGRGDNQSSIVKISSSFLIVGGGHERHRRTRRVCRSDTRQSGSRLTQHPAPTGGGRLPPGRGADP
jgi:hypothetical protein